MRKISAKMVPRILTHVQKQRRLHISSDLLRNAEMFDRVITGDETWCIQYDPETKRKSMRCTSHRTQHTSVIKLIQIILSRKIITVYSDNQTKLSNIYSGPCSIQGYRSSLNGQNTCINKSNCTAVPKPKHNATLIVTKAEPGNCIIRSQFQTFYRAYVQSSTEKMLGVELDYGLVETWTISESRRGTTTAH